MQSNQLSDKLENSTESSEFKVKTLEEIRAEKLARSQGSQSPKETPLTASTNDPSPGAKRPAPQNNKQIRIKRPKMSANVEQGTNEVPKPEVVKTESSPSVVITATAVDSRPHSTEADDYLDAEDDGDEDVPANAGALNDDELLLEIDNILGD